MREDVIIQTVDRTLSVGEVVRRYADHDFVWIYGGELD